MPIRIQNRRENLRRNIPGFQDAELEFSLADGVKHRFPLVELSVRGGSFRTESKLPSLTAGLAINEALLQVGELEISLHLEVLHVSPIEASLYQYGVRFYPTSENDYNELTGLVARLENLPE